MVKTYQKQTLALQRPDRLTAYVEKIRMQFQKLQNGRDV